MIICAVGDTPLVPITVTANGGQLVDLSSALSVTVVGAVAGETIFRRAVTGNQFGRVATQLTAADTATPRVIDIEVEVENPAGRTTYPCAGFLRVIVGPPAPVIISVT
jgi:hypothetical protein